MIKQEIHEHEYKEKMSYRKRLRAKWDLTSKQFWKLVQGVIKNSGALEEITLRELAKIFQEKCS